MSKKHSKRALFTSVLALVLCVAMLVGATFAWFTDQATTSLNTITAGTLDIALYNVDPGEQTKEQLANKELTITGAKLAFQKSENAPAGEAVLFEPGATYKLEQVWLKNHGNLHAAYKVVISGIDGDDKLAEALEVVIGEESVGTLAELIKAAENDGIEGGDVVKTGVLKPGEVHTFEGLALRMKTTAGNEYQGKTLENIAITVLATQAPVEYDSFNNTYDENAEYPEMPVIDFGPATDVENPGTTDEETGEFVSTAIHIQNIEKNYDIKIPEAAIVPAAGNPNPTSLTVELTAVNAENADGTGTTVYTLSIKDDKNNDLTLSKAATITAGGLPMGIDNVAVTNVNNFRLSEDKSQITMTVQIVGEYVVTYTLPKAEGVYTADDFIDAMAALDTNPGATITLQADIDMSKATKTWNGVTNKSFTLNGNNHTISNITRTSSDNPQVGGLVNSIGSGNSVIIKNLTIAGAKVSTTAKDELGKGYVGVIVGYADAARELTLENVTVTGATVNSTDYAGGLIGWNSGYSNLNDGPVYAGITIKNCKVQGSTITGIGSTGGAVGHAGANTATINTIINFQMTGTTLNNTEEDYKVGLIVGTANVGKVVISECDTGDFSGNTLKNTSNNTKIVGRLATSGGHGTLTINGTKYTTDQTNFFISQ